MTDMDQERIYQNALLLIEGRLYAEAADELARIPGYKDADKQRLFCEEKKATAHLDRIYEEADKAAANFNVRSQEKAIRIFETIPGWRDADQRIEQARRTIDEIVQKERVDRQEAIRRAEYEETVVKRRKRRRVRAALITAASAGIVPLKRSSSAMSTAAIRLYTIVLFLFIIFRFMTAGQTPCQLYIVCNAKKGSPYFAATATS